jgi:hypothetical protein
MQTSTDKPIAAIMAAIRHRERWEDIEELIEEAYSDLETIETLVDRLDEDDMPKDVQAAGECMGRYIRAAMNSLKRAEELVREDRA